MRYYSIVSRDLIVMKILESDKSPLTYPPKGQRYHGVLKGYMSANDVLSKISGLRTERANKIATIVKGKPIMTPLL